MKKSFVLIWINIFIAISISVTFYYLTSTFAVKSTENVYTFTSYINGAESYAHFRKEWKPRFFSNYLASEVTQAAVVPGDIVALNAGVFAERVALWNSVWLMLCFIVLILDRKNALLYIFGIFAGLCYAFTPAAGYRIYPWDLPVLFFYCLILVCSMRRQRYLLILVLALGTGFKETVALGCIVFLFWQELAPRGRFMWFCLSGVLCLAVKLGIDIMTGNPSPGLTMSVTNIFEENQILFLANLSSLTSCSLNHPIFVNAGTLLIFFLLPNGSKDFVMWKTIAAVCVIGNFVCGVFTEFRIFFETLPLCLWGLDTYIATFRD